LGEKLLFEKKNDQDMDKGTMTTLTSLYYDYTMLLQTTDAAVAIGKLQNIIRYLPSKKFEDLLMRANGSFSDL
jgi:hypothetical protein